MSITTYLWDHHTFLAEHDWRVQHAVRAARHHSPSATVRRRPRVDRDGRGTIRPR